MFNSIIFILLLLLLVISGGFTIYMGIFKAHRQNVSFAGKFVKMVVSFSFSALFWAACYSHHYLGW